MHPILILTQLVKRRIAMGKDAFYKRVELLRGGLSRKLKKRMVKTLVWSVVLYGSETWTMRQEDIKRLEAFEMWIWRRMEKISWVERRTNEEILQLVEEKRSLIGTIRGRQKKWIGHILRSDTLLPRQQNFRGINGACLPSPIRGELGYAHWPQLGTEFRTL